MRPNVFLCLVGLIVIDTIVNCLESQYFRGTAYRTFREVEFFAVLWLLTPYWGRRDLLLVRCHLRAMAVVLATVVLGLLVSPGHALGTGRLVGSDLADTGYPGRALRGGHAGADRGALVLRPA